MKVIKDVCFAVENVPADKIAALTAAIRAYRDKHLTEYHYVYRHFSQPVYAIKINLLISPDHAEALTKIVESFR